MNKALQGQGMWKDSGVCLQEPEAVLTVFHILAHRVLVASSKQEADALAQV